MFDLSPLLTRLPPRPCLALAGMYMVGIYILSSLQITYPDTGTPYLWSFLANLFHFPLYTGLGLLLLLGFRSRKNRDNRELASGTSIPALIVLCLYAAFDETHQSWSGRTPSLLDFFLDACGGLLALLILKYSLEKSLKGGRFLALFAGLSAVACCIAYVTW